MTRAPPRLKSSARSTQCSGSDSGSSKPRTALSLAAKSTPGEDAVGLEGVPEARELAQADLDVGHFEEQHAGARFCQRLDQLVGAALGDAVAGRAGFDDRPGRQLGARGGDDRRHEPEPRTLATREQQLTAGRAEARCMLRQLFVQPIRRHRADHVRAEHARDRDGAAVLLGGFERELDRAPRELRGAMLHAHLRQRARRRVGRERGQHVHAAVDFGAVVSADLVGPLAQQLTERAG